MEQTAVNRKVVGSSPTFGANMQDTAGERAGLQNLAEEVRHLHPVPSHSFEWGKVMSRSCTPHVLGI